MALKQELTDKVTEFARTSWGDIPNGYVVPEPEALTFGNTGIRIDACVLYADIRSSTEMVDGLFDWRAAEYYKAFLHCSAKILKNNEGTITAYDGDRVMAIFVGNEQAYRSVHAAFQINYAVKQIINPVFARVYEERHRVIQHTVGIDSGRLLAAKAGVRDDRDLVWVGPAANYAAKLNSFDGLDGDFPTRISAAVYANVNDKFFRLHGDKPVWDGPYWDLNKIGHYRSGLLIEIA